MDYPSSLAEPCTRPAGGLVTRNLNGRTNSYSRDQSSNQDYVYDDFDRALLAEAPAEEHSQASSSKSWASPTTNRPVLAADGYPYQYSGDHIAVRPRRVPSIPLRTSDLSSTLLNFRTGGFSPGNSTLNEIQDEMEQDEIQDGGSTSPANRFQFMTVPSLSTPQAVPVIQGIPLVSTSQLPDHLRSIFKFPILNAVQSKCFNTAYHSDDNMVISAPTGSGKTAIMELAICRLVMEHKNEDFKVVYQAPTKSLCSERYRDWSAKLSTLGLECAELTGDVEFANLRHVKSANVIIATPEKWDSATRKWKDNAKLMRMIRLFLVDEVHILKESRGATLEAVVSRMKSVGSRVRFVALSATIPNSDDIATWLGLNNEYSSKPAIRDVFGEEFRPTKLEKHVIGIPKQGNDFALDNALTKKIPDVITRYGKGKPVIIFCSTKTACVKTAKMLAEMRSTASGSGLLWPSMKNKNRVKNSELGDLLPSGVAFHHGALDAADRLAVETGFMQGRIGVICSTSTLAVGVNLPAYLVILKGTMCYTDNGLQEYSSLEIMQMLGRAGRPQFERSACAVILTSKEKIPRYERMIAGEEVVESSLHQHLIEHLNAEIGIGTVHDLTSAKAWLSGTFLNVRVKQNPQHYQLDVTSHSSGRGPDQLLQQICEKDIHLLEAAGLLQSNESLRCTDFGDAMARYYVRFETMNIFLDIPPKAKCSEILESLCRANELQELRWRSGEKALFKNFNKSHEIRYPIKAGVSLPAHKASLIIQIVLGGILLDRDTTKKHGLGIKQDSSFVLSICKRLIRCVIDIQLHRGDAFGARNALELCRSITATVWDDTPMQLKQIEGVGEVTVRKLAAAKIKSIDCLLYTESHTIELILGKNPPFGAEMLKKLSYFPSLRVEIKLIEKKQQKEGAALRMRAQIGFLNPSPPSMFRRRPVYVCFLCETSLGDLIDFRRMPATRMKGDEDIVLTTTLTKAGSYIACYVMCDEIAGTQRYAEMKPRIPDSWFPVATNDTIKPVGQGHCVPAATCTGSEFDDLDLLDENLFNMDEENVEVITADIDQLLAERNPNDQPAGLKRRRAGEETCQEDERLANGNWPCTHTCTQLGKDCKHTCCRQGCKHKPKRKKTATGSARKDSEPVLLELKDEPAGPESSNSPWSRHVSALAKCGGKEKEKEKETRSTDEPVEPAKFTAYDKGPTQSPSVNSIGSTQASGRSSGRFTCAANAYNTIAGKSNSISTRGNTPEPIIQDVDDFDCFDMENCDWETTCIEEYEDDVGIGALSSSRHQPLIETDPSAAAENVILDSKSISELSDRGDRIEEHETNLIHSTNPKELLCSPRPVYTSPYRISGGIGSHNVVSLSAVKGMDRETGRQLEDYETVTTDPVDGNEADPCPRSLICKAQLSIDEQDNEEQQRRWAQLPTWMFEQYGKYVKIVESSENVN